MMVALIDFAVSAAVIAIVHAQGSNDPKGNDTVTPISTINGVVFDLPAGCSDKLKACLTPIDAKYIQLCGTVDDIAHPCLCRSYPELDSCYDIYCSDPSKKPQLLTDALAKCKEKNTQVTDDSEASTTTNGGDEATEDGGDGDEMLKDDMAAMVTPSATGASGKLSVPLMMVWVFFAMFAVMAMAASVPVSQNYWNCGDICKLSTK